MLTLHAPQAGRHQTRARRRVLIALLTLALTVAASLTIGASAALASCTNPGLYFDGMNHSETLAGAQAYISRYIPRYCVSSSAWAMVDNTNNGDELAQVGWLRLADWGSTVYYFYEFGTSTVLNPPVQLGAVPNPGGLAQDKFSVFKQSDGKWTFNINTVSQDTESFSWTPNEGEWFAETHSYTDQTAGDTSNIVGFTTVAHLGSVGGTWKQDSPTTSYAYNGSPYGSGLWGSGSDFDVYDGRYSTEG